MSSDSVACRFSLLHSQLTFSGSAVPVDNSPGTPFLITANNIGQSCSAKVIARRLDDRNTAFDLSLSASRKRTSPLPVAEVTVTTDLRQKADAVVSSAASRSPYRKSKKSDRTRTVKGRTMQKISVRDISNKWDDSGAVGGDNWTYIFENVCLWDEGEFHRCCHELHITIEFWDDNKAFKECPSQSDSRSPLRKFAEDLIDGQDACDVRIDASSRIRVVDGCTLGARPLAIYANAELLIKRCDYFATMFQSGAEPVENKSGFAEGAIISFETAPVDSGDETDLYEYSSDSDLDSYDEDDESTSLHAPEQRSRSGRIVKVNGVAHRTLRALIFYLYTGHIDFAPLYSDAELVSEDVRQTSARSIYRIAHRFNIPELILAAKTHIIDNLTVDNIAGELARRFSSMYPELIEAETEFALRHIARVRKTAAWVDAVDRGFRGEIPHARNPFVKLSAV